MIDPKELRLGNWVLALGAGDDEPADVGYGYIAQIKSEEDKYSLGPEGIPLTSDILAKCGFVINDEQYWTKSIGWPDPAFVWGINLSTQQMYSSSIGKKISALGLSPMPKNLHELQNMYAKIFDDEIQFTP